MSIRNRQQRCGWNWRTAFSGMNSVNTVPKTKSSAKPTKNHDTTARFSRGRRDRVSVPRAMRNAPAGRVSPKKLGKLWCDERRRRRASHSGVMRVPCATVQARNGRRGSTAAARRCSVRRRPASRASYRRTRMQGTRT